MITAKIVKYYNDYNQTAFNKTFENLDELADWIFDQMQLDYTKKPGCDYLTFPTNKYGKWYEISVHPYYGGYTYWIHQINSETGIIFRVGNILPEKISAQKRFRNGYRSVRNARSIQASIFRRYKSGYYRKIQTVYAR